MKTSTAYHLDGVRVAMLLDHSGRNDTRVLREACTLRQAGAEVRVFCAHGGATPRSFVIDGTSFDVFEVPPAPILRTGSQLLRGVKSLVRPASISSRAEGLKLDPAEDENIGRARGSASPVRLATFAWEPWGILSAVRSAVLSFSPDVIHAHDLSTLPAGASLAGRIGSKLVYDSHEFETDRAMSFSLVEKTVRQRRERRFINKAHRVLTVSDSIADALASLYGIERPSVVLNVPDSSVAGANPDVSIGQRAKLGLPSDAKIGLYTGAIRRGRGLESAIVATSRLPDLHFAVMGPAAPGEKPRLQELAKRHGIPERFHVLEPVKPEDVVSTISLADFSWIPIENVCKSYDWALPNKLFQSVEAGVPVLVTPLTEMSAFVRHFKVGHVADSFDPISLSKAAERILSQATAMPSINLSSDYSRYRAPAVARVLLESYVSMLSDEPMHTKGDVLPHMARH